MSKNNSPEKCWVVIPAAGTGERFDQKVAKQYEFSHFTFDYSSRNSWLVHGK